MDEGLVERHIAEIVPYVPGKPIEELEREFGIPAGESVKLASNENPLGPSPLALRAAREALAQSHLYPDGGAVLLRRALAQRLGVQEAEVAVGAGSNELIDLLVRTFCAAGDEVLSSECTFLCYELSARAAGATFRGVPQRGYAYDLGALLEAVGPKTKLVFIANPNNPTGSYVDRRAFEVFCSRLAEHVILAVDEAYIEYVSADDFPDSLRFRDRRERLVALRTFSKARGLAGLRIGYAVAPAAMVSYLDRVRTPFNTSAVAQAAALAALDDEEHLTRSRRVNEEGKIWLGAELHRLGIHPLPTQANFLLCELPRPAIDVFRQLLSSGVIVRPMAMYGLPRHMRVTIGTAEQNRRFIEALRPLL